MANQNTDTLTDVQSADNPIDLFAATLSSSIDLSNEDDLLSLTNTEL